MSEISDEMAVQRGNEVRQFLDRNWEWLKAALQAGIHKDWASCQTKDGRDLLWAKNRMLEDLESVMNKAVGDGVVAENVIDRKRRKD